MSWMWVLLIAFSLYHWWLVNKKNAEIENHIRRWKKYRAYMADLEQELREQDEKIRACSCSK